MEILRCENLTKAYGSEHSLVTALDSVQLSVQKANSSPLSALPVPASPLCCICWAA